MARPYRTREDERDVFRALAHPVRRKIVSASLDQPCSFSYLCDITNRSETAMAGHLRILREAGVVTATRDGRTVTYRADRRSLRSAKKWLTALTAAKSTA